MRDILGLGVRIVHEELAVLDVLHMGVAGVRRKGSMGEEGTFGSSCAHTSMKRMLIMKTPNVDAIAS